MKKSRPSAAKKTQPSPEKPEPGPEAAVNAAATQTECFAVVGIGASAGGLRAFEQFFSAMPDSVGIEIAFVVVQHLDPEHPSLLCEILQKRTNLDVCEITDGMALVPGRLHVIPPNKYVALANGTLQVLDLPSQRGVRMPIDFFFRSLALDQRKRAICIVLSGTGSDGTQGLRHIKSEGGLALVQTVESAEFDGMPLSAIETGQADYVLAPAEMPEKIRTYVSHSFSIISNEPIEIVEPLKKICYLVHDRTGHDFSLYKKASLIRRIQRRMALQLIKEMEHYVRYLQQTPQEVDALFADLLIGVTQFFRDSDAFAAFEKTAIPQIFANHPNGGLVRVWVPGCSTGEEAYSIAILLKEATDELNNDYRVQIFATDIDAAAIEKARAGVYPASIANDISPERLVRFFTREPNGKSFRIHKSIRDCIIFSIQDVIKDPPFSKLDLISCRNMMIYMEAALQKRLIPILHFALNPLGVLFLGTSETAGDSGALFSTLDRKEKIYLRKADIRSLRRPIERFLTLMPSKFPLSVAAPARRPEKTSISGRELTERALLRACPLCAALVTAQGDILYLHGRSGHYLEPAQGNAGMNILTMARIGLQYDLTIALSKAETDEMPVSAMGLRVKTNGNFSLVNLTVRPVDKDLGGETKLFLVVLEDAAIGDNEKPPGQRRRKSTTDREALIDTLQNELRTKDEILRASTEELRASNEEMQSTNEEIQSTNEELETSKEEMQSLNEELTTLNAELQTKVFDLAQSNNDLSNLMSATGIGMIFVDNAQKIMRFTPPTTKLINLIPSDIGRPVGHITTNLVGYTSLVQDIQSVLDTLVLKEIEVRTSSDVWFLLGIRTYRTVENIIEGAVITFTEISKIKAAKESIKESADLLQLAQVVKSACDAIIVRDMQCRILAWNPAATKMYGWSEEEALAMSIVTIIPEEQRQFELEAVQRLARASTLEPYPTQRIAKDGSTVEVVITATQVADPFGKISAIVTTERQKPT